MVENVPQEDMPRNTNGKNVKTSYKASHNRREHFMNDKLTPKQQDFAKYYADTGNARQSAIRAGYSENRATEQGYENVRKPHIKAEIDRIKSKTAKDYDVSRERQIQRLVDAYDLAKEQGQSSAMTSAARELNEMSGWHREKAINPEKEADRAAKMTDEERILTELTVQARLDMEARKGVKLVKGA